MSTAWTQSPGEEVVLLVPEALADVGLVSRGQRVEQVVSRVGGIGPGGALGECLVSLKQRGAMLSFL